MRCFVHHGEALAQPHHGSGQEGHHEGDQHERLLGHFARPGDHDHRAVQLCDYVCLDSLVGIGVLPVKKMLPMTLGANIGTTFTSMFAALAVMKFDSIQIAFCHLLFNIIGILVWFPVPMARMVVIKAACTLGFYASYWRFVPLIYILTMFVAVPGISLAISLLYTASVAAGIVVTLLALAGVARPHLLVGESGLLQGGEPGGA